MVLAADDDKQMIELPTDGERFLPGMGGRIAAEHLLRYAFAERFVANKKILDVASGEGYGAAIMAENAAHVTGVDIAEDASIFAQRKYANITNLEFQRADINALPFENDAFDVITCFETIEHVDSPETAIEELSRVLKPNGVLFVSTPNKENYSARFDYDNPFHKMELEFTEFKQVLSRTFKHVKFFGQFAGTGSFSAPLNDKGHYDVPHQTTAVSHADVVRWTGGASGGTADPLYFIAVCSNQPQRQEPVQLEFFDPTDWRTIEDEFLFRQIRSSPDINESLLKQLISQLNNLDVLRNELKLANHKITLERTRSDNELAEEVKVLRSAFNSLKEQYHDTRRLKEELVACKESLAAVEASTAWRATHFARKAASKSRILRRAVRTMFSTTTQDKK